MRVGSVRNVVGVLAGLALFGCKGGDPKTAKYWVEKIQADKTEHEKKADADHLSAVAKASKEPGLTATVASLLKDQPGDVIATAATTLGDLGDKSAVPALVDAIDLSRGAGADHQAQAANHANKAIAEALGKLGDKGGTPGLMKLLKSKDNYTVIAAINALGEVKDASAVKALSDIATDSSSEPLVNKKAIMALGSIGDAAAVPAVHQMLFQERTDRGISFFAESSFAMYEIGQPATEVLLTDLKGGTPEFKSWAQGHNVEPGAIIAKSAQILGDLSDPRAEKSLLALLAYKDDNAQLQAASRMQAADALGRMRSKAAVKPLVDALGEADVSTRATYYRALTFIGDHAATAAALKKAEAKESIDYREPAYKTAALTGDGSDLKTYDAAVAGEGARLKQECADNGVAEADCPAQTKERTDRIAQYRAALATGCASGDVKCWSGKLADANPYVREHAAFELGRSGKADALAPLLAAVQKPLDGKSDADVTAQDEARFAAILGTHWLLASGVKADGAAATADALDKQADEERKKTATMRSAEDVKRLAIRLRRG